MSKYTPKQLEILRTVAEIRSANRCGQMSDTEAQDAISSMGARYDYEKRLNNAI